MWAHAITMKSFKFLRYKPLDRLATRPSRAALGSGFARLGAYFLSFLQTSSLLLSPAGTDSSRTCARLCRRDFVLHKYLLFKSDIRKGDWRTSAICRPSCRAIAIGVASFVVMFRPMLPGRPIYRRAYFFGRTFDLVSLDAQCHTLCVLRRRAC